MPTFAASTAALTVAVFLLTLFGTTSVSSGDPPSGTLVCVGDSITAGESVTAAQCYVGQLRAKAAGEPLTVVADGRSGWTTGAFVANAKDAVAKVPADATAITILLGTNDARSAEPPAKVADEAAANLRRLVAAYRAKAPAASFVIVSPPAVDVPRLSQRLRQADYGPRTVVNLAAIRWEYRATAAELGARYVDLSMLPTAGHTVDGVHPDAVGHTEIAEAIWATLTCPPPTGTLVCVGASITAGEGAPTPAESYVGRLRERAKDAGLALTVVNQGRSGWSTVDYLKHADAVVAKMPADATFVTFQLGTNDTRSKDPTNVMADRAATDLEKLVYLYRAKAPRAAFVVMAPTRFDPTRMAARLGPAGYGERTPERLAAVSRAYAALASRLGLRFVDLSDVPTAGHSVDGLHPDAAGHAQVAGAIWAALCTPAPAARP